MDAAAIFVICLILGFICLFFYIKNIYYAMSCKSINEAIVRLTCCFFPIAGIIAGCIPSRKTYRI